MPGLLTEYTTAELSIMISSNSQTLSLAFKEHSLIINTIKNAYSGVLIDCCVFQNNTIPSDCVFLSLTLYIEKFFRILMYAI